MKNDMDKDILLKQKRLPMGFLAVWLMLITTIQWMILDMYLPALPVLVKEFGVSEAALNVSLNAGIIAAAVSTLFGGTLSDRYGRRSVIITGLLIGVAGNLFCAFSGGIFMLCVMRALSGIGSGIVETVAAAILKDSFTGRRFKKNMTILQAVAAIGPIFAPVLGAFLINISSWRFIFIFLAIAIFVTLIPMLVFTETLPQENRFSNNFGGVIKEAFAVAKAPAFSLMLGIGALLTIPVWAYVAVSSYVFINDFALSNTVYGIYYAIGTAFSVFAPVVYLILSKCLKNRVIIRITLILTLLCGILLMLVGALNPIWLLICAALMYLSEGIIRPLGLVILMEEYSHISGSVSAIMQFVVNVVGAIGTALATMGWHSMVHGTGIITIFCAVISILFWIRIRYMGLLKEYL